MSIASGALLDAGALAPVNENQLTREKVLAREIPWEGYQRAALLSERELELIRRYDRKPEDVKRGIFEKDGDVYAEVLVSLVSKITSLETLQYVLTLINDLLTVPTVDSRKIALFLALSERNPEYPLRPFLRLLSRSEKDWYTSKQACSILSVLLRHSPVAVNVESAQFFLRWVAEQLRLPNSPDLHIATQSLIVILQQDSYRAIFMNEAGLALLLDVIRNNISDLALVYEAVYCLWLLTFNANIASSIENTGLIALLVDLVKTTAKEKILRLSLSTLRNLIDKSTNNEEMIDAGMIRMLAILGNRKYADEDIADDVKALSESLAKNMVVLSSFDMYRKEVLSGEIQWSPVHKSEKFWRENCTRFEENDYQLLRTLDKILKTSNNTLELSVVCYDLGEFARFHPRGKILLQQLTIKMSIMPLMVHQDPDVKRHALYAIQKMMVHNWEYLAQK